MTCKARSAPRRTAARTATPAWPTATSGRTIECPLHQGVFDIRSGKPKCPPVDRPAPLRGEGGRRCHLPEGGSRVNAGAIVIVGAGQAGGWAATTLRDRGYDGRIVLLGDEPHAPYGRPPLSKAVLSARPWRKAPSCSPRTSWSRWASSSSPASRRCGCASRTGGWTSAGQALAYDKLILCTGGHGASAALPGVDHDGVHVLRTRADAERLRARLGPDRHVLIVGGGWIGLEVAAGAPVRQQGHGAGREARLCARSVQPGVSAHLATLHAANGVALRLNAGLRAVGGSADGRPVAELADGSSIAADAIVLGVGRPPTMRWRATPALPAIAACWWTSVAARRRRTYTRPAMWPCRAARRRPLAAGVLAERAGSGHGGGAVGAGPGRSVSADRRGLVGAIRRHGADRRLSGAGGQRGAAAQADARALLCRWRWMRKAAPWRA